MAQLVFTKLDGEGAESDLGRVWLENGAVRTEGAVQSFYDWTRVVNENDLHRAFQHLVARVIGRYLYVEWKPDTTEDAVLPSV